MGTITYSVRVVTEDHSSEHKKELQEAVNSSLQRVNELMSTYLEDSDISKFNRFDSTEWMSIDIETVEVVERALEISKLTNGAFDPTVGPAVNVWNFGPNKKEATLPSEEEIAELKTVVGFETIEVRSDPPGIRKQNQKAQLDLSAIAKGYAVDRVARSLNQLGEKNFMVEVGGEVVTRGERVGGGPWKVAVEKPDASVSASDLSDRIHRVVALSGKALATSGDYRNFFEVDGKRYSHTIDPKTCKPVDHNLAVASVVADDCVTADAIATAVMVMGPEQGSTLCKKFGYPLLTVVRSNSTNGLPYVTFNSPDFPIAAEESKAGKATGDPKSKTKTGGQSILPVFLATFCVFCLFVLGMAIGAIFNNKPVTGSCGGIANMKNEDGEDVCGICSKPTVDCTETVDA